MILYKGAGPGSHWWSTNAQLSGFTVAAAVQGVARMVRHITAFSHPSPYLSFSASFAIAREYALAGPAGQASQTQPGRVYEIDTTLVPGSMVLSDPVRDIVGSNPALTVARLPTHHDGAQNLILGIASPILHGAVLTSPPARVPGNALQTGPAVQSELQAVVFALRDAEVLIGGNVPPNCITAVYPVY